MALVDCPVLNQAASQPTDLNDLQDQALGQIGKLQSDAQAEADALQGQVTEQGQALQQQAQAKVEEMKGRADAMRNRGMGMRDQAISQAGQMRDQAISQAGQMRDQAISQAGQMRDQAISQAGQMRDQAISQAGQMRDQAISQVSQMRDQAIGQANQYRDQAMAMRDQAIGQAKQYRDQAMALRDQATQLRNNPRAAMQAVAFAAASKMRDQMTGMLQMPPAASALMQESAAEPLPDKERAREKDLEPFADDEEQDDQGEQDDEGEQGEGREPAEHKKPMSMQEWLQAQLQEQLQLAAECAAARAKQYLASQGLPSDVPPDGEDLDPQKQFDEERQRVEDQARDVHPEAPPYDDETAAALAGFGQVSDMMKDLIGKSLLDDKGAGEMQELVGSFGECTKAIPQIDPAQLNAMNVAGGMAKLVEQVRAKFNVDLLQQGAGAQLAGLLSKARQLDPAQLQEAAAQRVAKWLPLASFAKSVNLPVNGPGALGRLGDAAKWASNLKMPDAGKAAADLMGHMDNAAAVKRVFGADPFSRGAASSIAPKLEQVRANAEEAMSRAQGAARQAQGIAENLSRSSIAQVAKIDRSQARDLALGKIRHASTPLLNRAAPVLSTLRSVRDATGKRVTMSGKASWTGKW